MFGGGASVGECGEGWGGVGRGWVRTPYMLPLAGEASSAILLLSFWLVQSLVMSSR